MNQPPQWTNAISNAVLCDFYYVFFIIFAIFAAISLLGGIYIFFTTKMPFSSLIGVFFNIILTGGLSATSALFLYLICDRSLQPNYPSNADGFQDAAKKEGFKEGFEAGKKEGFYQSCEFKNM
jgi:hypothetical protein